MTYLNEIDIPSAKERFMGNEALYKKFLLQMPEKDMVTEILQHMDEKNIEEAFKAAHTMKGVVGNLSLNQLLAKVSDVVEPLRAGNLPEQEKVDAMKEAYERAMAAIEEVKEQNLTLF